MQLRVVAVAEMRHFECLFALELGVLHEVDGPHATAAELFLDAIAPELRGQLRWDAAPPGYGVAAIAFR